MAPTKAMAMYAVITLSLPTNVMTLLPEIPLGLLPLRAPPRAQLLWLTESELPKKSAVLSFNRRGNLTPAPGMVKEG